MTEPNVTKSDAEETSDRVTITDVTLPDSPENLNFYRADDGTVYAEHVDTGELTAISGDAETTITPAIADMEAMDSIDGVVPMPSQDGTSRRRGD